MEDTTVFCKSCGKKFDKKHLSSNVHRKLKKNVTHFRKFFKIETVNSDDFKFCRKCENEWLELNKLVDKQKIEDFIAEKKITMDAIFLNDDGSQYEQKETKDKQFDLAIPGSSGTQVKSVNISDKKQSKSVNVKESQQVQYILNQNEVTSDINTENQPGSSTGKNVGKGTVKDYEYWKLLAQRTFLSDGIGAKTREEYKYYIRKTKEAEANGFAEDEIKDYNYWQKLFIGKFKSEERDKECEEDLDYYYKKMHETKNR